MADFVTIANLAASAIGEDDQLRSPDDDTHLSRSVRAVWDLQRRAAIRAHTWNFATRRALLPALADTVPYGWAFEFRLPADSLRVVEVLGKPAAADRRDYQVEGKSILADVTGPLPIRYLIDVAEPALWDDSFVDTFAMRIAWTIADRITGDLNRVISAEKKYLAALRAAKRADANENPPVAHEATGWERARGWGGEVVDRNGMVFP